MENKILLIGGGGNCKSIIDVILEDNLFSEIGIIDNNPVELSFDTKKIFYAGNDLDLEDLFKKGWNQAFVSVGSVGNTDVRENIHEKLKKIGFFIPNIISNSAFVSKNCTFGYGNFVAKGAVVNFGATIGNCCIINSNSIVEHDCSLGDFVHVSPGAILLGGVKVGNKTHIGAGCVIKQYLIIGDKVMVGMGSVVTKSLDANNVYYGNPCRFVRKR